MGPAHAGALGRQQVHRTEVLEHRDVRVGTRAGQESALDLAARGVLVVEHAPLVVAAFAAEREIPALAPIELDAELAERLDRLLAPFDTT